MAFLLIVLLAAVHVSAASSAFLVASGAITGVTAVSRWNSTSQSWSPLAFQSSSAPVNVLAMAVLGDRLVVGGSFAGIGGVTAANVAQWDGVAWSPLGSGTNGQVVALLPVGVSSFYIGGNFQIAGGVAANYIAQWNGGAWAPVGTGVSSVVLALTAYNGHIVAGLTFYPSVGYVASWNGAAWSPLGSLPMYYVNALAVYGGILIAGGAFQVSFGDPLALSFIAQWNGASWSALGAGVNLAVRALAVLGNVLVAGGMFTNAGGVAAQHMAKWDGSSWSALAGGTSDVVLALAVLDGTHLAVGGQFASANGATAMSIAFWDGATWSTVGTDAGLCPFGDAGGGACASANALTVYCAVGSGAFGLGCTPCPACASGQCYDGPRGNGTCVPPVPTPTVPEPVRATEIAKNVSAVWSELSAWIPAQVPCVSDNVILSEASNLTIAGRARAFSLTLLPGASLTLRPLATLELPKPNMPQPYWCSAATPYPVTAPVVLSAGPGDVIYIDATLGLPLAAADIRAYVSAHFRDDNGEPLRLSLDWASANATAVSADAGAWLVYNDTAGTVAGTPLDARLARTQSVYVASATNSANTTTADASVLAVVVTVAKRPPVPVALPDGQTRVWTLTAGSAVTSAQQHSMNLTGAAVDPDGFALTYTAVAGLPVDPTFAIDLVGLVPTGVPSVVGSWSASLVASNNVSQSVTIPFTLSVLPPSGDRPQHIALSGTELWNDASSWTEALVPCVSDDVVLTGGSNMTITGRARAFSLTLLPGASLTLRPLATLELPKPNMPQPYWCSAATPYPVTAPVVLSAGPGDVIYIDATLGLPLAAADIRAYVSAHFRDDNGEPLRLSLDWASANATAVSADAGAWLVYNDTAGTVAGTPLDARLARTQSVYVASATNSANTTTADASVLAVVVTVAKRPPVPVALPDVQTSAWTLTAGSAVTFAQQHSMNLTGAAVDPDGFALTYTAVVGLPADPTFAIDLVGLVPTGVPSVVGSWSASLVASNNVSQSVTIPFTLNVAPAPTSAPTTLAPTTPVPTTPVPTTSVPTTSVPTAPTTAPTFSPTPTPTCASANFAPGPPACTTCLDGYFGSTCAYACTTCSANGVCIPGLAGNCTCNAGFSGNDCTTNDSTAVSTLPSWVIPVAAGVGTVVLLGATIGITLAVRKTRVRNDAYKSYSSMELERLARGGIT